MENLIVFTVSFVLIFIIYLVIYFVKRKKRQLYKMKEFTYLISKFNIDKSKLNYNKLGLIFVLVNSLIISITGTICTMVKLGYIWQFVIGFALLMAFIYIVYGFIGKILKKKELKENVNPVKERRKKNDKHK